MSAMTTTFDVRRLKHALARWDVAAILECYTDDVEHREIDQLSPPSAPRVRTGKAELAEALRDYEQRGILIDVDDAIVAGDRAAFSTTCTAPDGDHVYGISLLDLRDGKIARQVTVQAWDE